MEQTDLAPAIANPPRRIAFRVLVAIGGALALYAAPLAYFLTACMSSSAISERFEWLGVVAVIIPMAFPAYFAIAAVLLVAALFGALSSTYASRIRNVVLPVAVAVLFFGALVFGSIAPTRCSIF